MEDNSQIPSISKKIFMSFSEIFKLTSEQINEIGTTVPIPFFDQQTCIEMSERAKVYFKSIESMINVPTPTYIVGDLHGNLFDLLRILIMCGLPPLNRFLFLGDYVDRGQYSVEIIMLLFSLVVLYPNHIFLIRGNHEFERVNEIYGFKDEVKNLYEKELVYESFNSTFEWMPLTALVGDSIFAVHGGISPQITGFRQLQRMKRPISSYDNSIASDLVWSDPSKDCKDYFRSSRGNGMTYGNKAIDSFLKSFNIKHIIRAHQCVPLGIERFHGDSVYTVFSCSNYQESHGNKLGLIFIKEDETILSYSLPPIEQIDRKIVKTILVSISNLNSPSKTISLSSLNNNLQRNSILCMMNKPQSKTFMRKRSSQTLISKYGSFYDTLENKSIIIPILDNKPSHLIRSNSVEPLLL